jgi:hypothetical protein
MKKSLLLQLIVWCIGLSTAIGQGELSIGVNASPLLRQAFNMSDEPAAFNPYLFLAEYRLTSFGIRTGLGINNRFNRQLPDAIEGTPQIETTDNAMNFRLGYVRYRNLGEKWQVKYGLDMYYWNTTLDITTITNDFFGNQQTATALSTSHELGLSPFVYFQWNLNDRFSLGTEILGSIGYVNTLTREKNSQFPDFDDTDESEELKYNILPPTALYLMYRW